MADFTGGKGNDTISGTAESDNIYGRGGSDQLFGGFGNDVIYGEAGNDVVNGNDGHDTLVGGDGKDTLTGDVGRDILYGGSGADKFSYRLLWDSTSGALEDIEGLPSGYFAHAARNGTELGVDQIMDFNKAEGDRIDFVRLESELGTPLFMASQPGGGKGAIWVDNQLPGKAFLYINLDHDEHAEFMIEISGSFQSITSADLIF